MVEARNSSTASAGKATVLTADPDTLTASAPSRNRKAGALHAVARRGARAAIVTGLPPGHQAREDGGPLNPRPDEACGFGERKPAGARDLGFLNLADVRVPRRERVSEVEVVVLRLALRRADRDLAVEP
ncbi:hypothetical protein [Streptomyces sp. NPDC051452]|uniref:hypothetical protein n=1 Tax=Streptomyces sp. NPDC051452 TaxID=3365654 RepID=UPI0037BCFC7F